VSVQKPSGALDLVDQLLALRPDSGRRSFTERHPELLEPSSIEELCREVARQIAVDLERAETLSGLVRWLADLLGDERCRGLAARAAANVLHSSGSSEQAHELYVEALDRFRALGADLETAITSSSALLNLAYLGKYSTAFEWEERARGIFERLGDRLRLAILEHNFGNVLCRQDRWQAALERYSISLTEFEGVGRFQDVAICLRNIAVCQINLHRFEEALEVYRQCRAYCQQHGLTRVALQAEYNIAYLYFLRGEYARAIRRFEAVRRLTEEEGDDYHRALCDLDQAEIYLELNMVEESARLARQAVELFDQLKRPYERAKGLTLQALAESRAARGALALELLARARLIFEQEGNQLWLALLDFYRAVVLQREGQPEEAIQLARGALQIFDRSGVSSRAAFCELLLCQLLLNTQRLPEARRMTEEALRRLATLDLPALEFQAYSVLGQLEEALGQPLPAVEAYRHSLQRLERLRSGLQGEDLKISFTKDKQSVYEALVWLTVQWGPQEVRAADAFQLIEKAKSRGLADLMASRVQELAAQDRDDSALTEKVRALREELNWLYRQMDLLPLRAPESQLASQQESEQESRSEEVDRLRQRARGKEDELLRALRELQATNQEMGSLQAGFLVDLPALRAALGSHATLLEYFIARRTLVAVVVASDRLEVHVLGSSEAARRHHRLLQLQLTRQAQGGTLSPGRAALVERATACHLRDLYACLVAPLRSSLGTRHLVLAPHGYLHYIPFHALLDGDRALIEDFTISYAPSAGVYTLCAAKQGRWENRSLVLGVPDERAPLIEEEARAVAEALPRATLLLGDEVGERPLFEARNCRFIHVATHGLFRQDNPMFSAIRLGRSRLSLFDLYNLRLEAELVVLSGCGTGLNAVLGADELVGLTRGLLYAGAQSVLVTLWDIHDARTATFMRCFYRHLGQGGRRAEALRSAMLEMRAQYRHPYYWAPFVLVGQEGSHGE
jgi:CHAT domain-containing protein